MTENGSAPAMPPGWYFDPENRLQLRWFDGAAWTEHYELLPNPPRAIVIDEPNPFTEEFVVKTAVPEGRSWYAQPGVKGVGYVPPVNRSGDNSIPAAERDDNDDFDKDDDIGSSWTVEMWVLAILPLVAFACQAGLAYGVPGIFLNTPGFIWVIPIAAAVVGPVAATLDKGALASRNIRTAPHGALGILPPIYLLMRTFSVGASSVAPLIIWCISVVALYTPTVYIMTSLITATQGTPLFGGQ